MCFHRQIKNPVIFPKTQKGEIRDFQQSQKNLENKGLQEDFPSGAEHTMGVAQSSLAPDSGGEVTSTVTSFDSILSIRRMRYEEDNFVIGFDTEFYYEDKQRYVISWQFAFVSPDAPDCIEEVIVFSSGDETLALSDVVVFIIENWSIDSYFGSCAGGIQYSVTRRWEVPVLNRNREVVARRFSSFDDAVNACCDPEYKKALSKLGPNKKCIFDYVDIGNGVEKPVPRRSVNGYGLGYINDYSECDKDAIPVTLVSHFGSADLTALNVESKYEKDLMKKVSSVQGGLVTLKDFYIHNPKHSQYWKLYPIKVSVRDTMCYAPAGVKSLKALGDAVGVPKIEVLPPYNKSKMLEYMKEQLGRFCDYAVNDAVIALVYSGELWGYNKVMPVTITSASTRVAVPVIKSVFGLTETDNAGFDLEFRGLHRVKKGLSLFVGDKSGYIENTALEPVSDDARILQEYARQAYKGGFNGCLKPGYYENETYDYDLCNAYPTCMGLVPDIDWSHPLAFENIHQPLTNMMVRSPFDPVFAYVTFKFPESVKVPCIPVSVDGSLIYPYTNGDLDGVYASAPELWLALQLGAEVYAKRLYVGTIRTDEKGQASHSLFHVVKQMIKDRTVAKSEFGKDSVLQLLIKTATNGLYGKTAQDVIDKHTWSARTEAMENIGGSRITSPVHACLTTAGVRAVLVAALNQISDLGYEVYSVTTDGFISDVPEEVLNDLDLYGLSWIFRSCRTALTGSDKMWEKKHQNPELLNLTTRGNCSLETGDADNVLPGVMAHNSFVTGYEPDSYEDRQIFMYLSMTREGRLKTSNISFETFRNLAKKDGRVDFSTRDQDRFLSMDFDLKRKPIPETMVNSYRYFIEQDDVGWVASFDTVAYDSPEEFMYYKSVGKSCGVLSTVEDWSRFFDKIKARSSGVRRNITDLEWSKLVSCVMAYRLGIPLDTFGGPVSIPFLDDPNHSVKEKVAWINHFNDSEKDFTENTWKDCRKQTRASQVLTEMLFIDKLKDMVYWTP